MWGRLKGEVALVTGAARRLGRAVALAIAEAGADVVVHYRDSQREAEALREEIIRRGVRSWTAQTDFRSPEAVESLVDRAVASAQAPLSALVNNASIFPSGSL